ncbi:MAG: FMN-binding protein [Planctomycetota bacterium]
MTSTLRYPLVLGLVSVLSGLSLYATYSGTKARTDEQNAAARVKALAKVFLAGYGTVEETTAEGVTFVKVWRGPSRDGAPDFYALEGRGAGYNGSVPVTLLAGFTNPQKPGPEAAGKAGRVLVGWSVTRSEETPGLGENAKATAAPYTFAGLLAGRGGNPGADRRTPFQRQFADPASGRAYAACDLKLKKDGGDLDGITGATITSRAVIRAIQDADARLARALGETP